MSDTDEQDDDRSNGTASYSSNKPIALSDDPKISSAALCIQLLLVDDLPAFRPEFTHQCFPGERIRGYQPHQDVLPTDRCHKSYQDHDAANQELAVMVQLAPSGQSCTVQVKIRKKRFLRTNRPGRFCSPTKRFKAADSDDEGDLDIDIEESSSGSEAEEESDFSEADVEAEDNDNDDDEEVSDVLDPQGETRQRRLSPAEILHALEKALPKVKRRGSVKDDYLKAPVGVQLHSYERKGAEFCVCLAEGKEAAAYHSSVQKLALLFIENADDVDVATEDGGYWKVLYLFRKHAPRKFSLAGYVTLFHFSAPFRKPLAGKIVRICQAVVLPPYQRSGHGRDLLHIVHDLANGKFDKQIGKYGRAIVEINVEDPAPGFAALRNLVDYERYTASKMSSKDWLKDVCKQVGKDSYFDLLSESSARDLSRMSKLTVQQMQIVHEIDRLHGLLRTGEKQSQKYDKKYRLMVKKRLNRDNKEDLSTCRSKEAMKQLLDELYTEQRIMYDRILERACRPSRR